MKKRHLSARTAGERMWWYSLLYGAIVILCLFFFLTWQTKNRAMTSLREILHVMESRITQYDLYMDNDQVKSLVRLLDKTSELSDRLAAALPEDVPAFLDRYAADQRLTGILVLDENMDPVWQTASDGDTYAFLLPLIQGENVCHIPQQKKRAYLTEASSGGQVYDFVAAPRTDAPGVVAAYALKDPFTASLGEGWLEVLFSGDSFDLGAVVAVSDGTRVLASNLDSIVGRTLQECDLFSTRSGQDSSGLLKKHSTGGDLWFGLQDAVKDYRLFAYAPASQLYASRRTVLGYCAAIYLLLWLGFALLRQWTQRENLQKLNTQYRIIGSIGSLYKTGFLLHLDRGTMEIIIDPPVPALPLGGTLPARETLDGLEERYIAPTYREGHRAFTQLDTVAARLAEAPYLTYTYQDINGNWIKSEIAAQEYDRQGTLVGALLLSRDVTVEKRRELEYQDQIIHAMKDAERANMAKTDFLRRMSHDVRTPINGIRGMVEISRHFPGDEEKQEECRQKILAASGFLLELVNNVLDMNKLESGQIHLEEKPFDLTEILERTVSIVEAQAREKGITFQWETRQWTHSALMGSPLHLQQVLQNIAGNAVKYNRENGAVYVSCQELSCVAGTVQLRFTCRDTGRGMSEEFQKHAFEPFAQEDTSAHTSYVGTGLGLAITRELVERMGGTITFTSKLGEGTCFTVILPFRVAGAPAAEGPAEVPEKNALRGVRILLVEDNEMNMEIARFLLEQEGAVITEAWNGREALETFRAAAPGAFDVILMDMMMPVMNGLEAARAIRALDRPDAGTVAIFAMTANVFDDDARQSREAGIDEHLGKPLELPLLVRTILRYCRERPVSGDPR